MQRAVTAKHIFHNAICQQPFTTFHAQWSLHRLYAKGNLNNLSLIFLVSQSLVLGFIQGFFLDHLPVLLTVSKVESV